MLTTWKVSTKLSTVEIDISTPFEKKLMGIINQHSITYDHADMDLQDKILESVNDLIRKLDDISDLVFV